MNGLNELNKLVEWAEEGAEIYSSCQPLRKIKKSEEYLKSLIKQLHNIKTLVDTFKDDEDFNNYIMKRLVMILKEND